MAKNVTPEEFASEVDRLARVGIPTLEVEFHKGLHFELRDEIEERSPVGHGYPGAGQFKRLHHSSAGARPKKGGEARAALANLRAGQKSFIVNVAPHAKIVEGGRKPGRGGRMLGSPQAPHGVYGPSVDSVEGRIGAIFDKAAAAVDRKMGQ